MRTSPTIIAVLLCMLCSACASFQDSKKKFSHFHHQEQFNIAALGLYRVGIVGIIDDTKKLSAKEKQQLSENIYAIFGKRVGLENLIPTEELAQQVGVNNYQQIFQLAKQQDTQNIINSYQHMDAQPARYLLVSRLTRNQDLYKDDYAHTTFSFDNRCNTHGWAIGLTMTIIDTADGTEVWGGHLNKDNKSKHCEDDNDDFFYDDDKRSDKNDVLAGLAILLVASAIADTIDQNQDDGPKHQMTPMFREAVKDFAKELPSIYFR